MYGNKPSVDPATSEGVSDGKNQDVNPEGHEDANLIELPADQEQFVSALEENLGDAALSGAIHQLIADPENGIGQEQIERYSAQLGISAEEFITRPDSLIASFHYHMHDYLKSNGVEDYEAFYEHIWQNYDPQFLQSLLHQHAFGGNPGVYQDLVNQFKVKMR